MFNKFKNRNKILIDDLDDSLSLVRESKFRTIKNWILEKKKNKAENPDKPEFYKFDIYCKSEEESALICKNVFGIAKFVSAGCFVTCLLAMVSNPVLSMIGLGLSATMLYKFDDLYMRNISKFEKISELKKDIKEFDNNSLESENKNGVFSVLKNKILKNKDKSVNNGIESTELNSSKERVKNSNNAVSKLTREEKIAKVKEECKLGCFRVNNVTSYCIYVAKQEVKLQRFIKSEYKKENPDERIHSFEVGNTKVLVFANRPNFK